MIYDMLANVQKYRGISKNLDTAIDFLVKTDLSALPLGRTEIDGDNVFANVMEAQAKPVEELHFEIHKKYMDIQIDIEGTELICIGLGDSKELTHLHYGTRTLHRLHGRGTPSSKRRCSGRPSSEKMCNQSRSLLTGGNL